MALSFFDSQLQELGLDTPWRPQLADYLDVKDPLKDYRQKFCIPRVKDVSKAKAHDPNRSATSEESEPLPGTLSSHGTEVRGPDDPCIYLCGNSLGLQPRETRQLLLEELDVWSQKGVHGHFDHPYGRPWVSVDDDQVVQPMSRIVGANPDEVAVLNSLTVNLHFLMLAFYRPTSERFKILIEDKAFPSDMYAVASQLRFHGFDPETGIIALKPRSHETTLRTEDIVEVIRREGSQLALIAFSGVQYYTGQCFDMEAITRAGHEQGCVVGFDLAHAVGNVVLKLHDWQVDFASWCSYKYLNAGPGAIAGLFIHERHFASVEPSRVRLEGWWSNRLATRFQMNAEIDRSEGAAGFRMSNPSVLNVVSLYASLKLFDTTSMEVLRKKSLLLTGYLSYLLHQISRETPNVFQILTPEDESQRGCQLSLKFRDSVSLLFQHISAKGVVCDKREPDCLRLAPVPLYTSFRDVYDFALILRSVVRQTT